MGGREDSLESRVKKESTWLNKFLRGVKEVGRAAALTVTLALPAYIAGCAEEAPITPFVGTCDEIASAPRIRERDKPRVYGRTRGEVEKRLVQANFSRHDIKVHEYVARALECVGDEIKRRACNYPIRRVHSQRYVEPDKPRMHFYGIAVDINPDTNPECRWGGAPKFEKHWERCQKWWENRHEDLEYLREQGVFDMPDCVVKAFEKYGFEWGGKWTSKKDFMHFEWAIDPRALTEQPVYSVTDQGLLRCKPLRGVVNRAIASHEHGADRPEGRPTYPAETFRITRYYTPKCDDPKFIDDWDKFKKAVEMNGSGICDGKIYSYKSIGNSLETSIPNGYSRGRTACHTDAEPKRTIAVNDKPGTRCHIPYGSKVYLDFGYGKPWTGWYVAEDTGKAFHGKCAIDVYVGIGEKALNETKGLVGLSGPNPAIWVIEPESSAYIAKKRQEEKEQEPEQKKPKPPEKKYLISDLSRAVLGTAPPESEEAQPSPVQYSNKFRVLWAVSRE